MLFMQDSLSSMLSLAERPISDHRSAGNKAGILAEFGGFALKAVNLLDDLDRQENMVILEIEERIGVMEQDVGVENVILFHGRMS